MKYLFLIAIFLCLSASAFAQDKPDLSSKTTIATTAAAVTMTIIDTEYARAKIASGIGCEANAILRAGDGCQVSRTKAYGLSAITIGGSLVVQKFKPEWAKAMNAIRLCVVGGHVAGFTLSFRFRR
jgi:hypothetical protein